jgi:hypothetical protein
MPYATRTPNKPILATEVLSLPSGKVHRLHTIDDFGWQEPVKAAGATLESTHPGSARETYNGNDREASKTIISLAVTTSYADLASLVTTLPDDDFMRNSHLPPISKDRNSKRVQEEERNVTLVAYLVATKKENDNDYHLILANTPGGDGPYLTAEVSGLPRMGSADNRTSLTNARKEYRQVMGGKVPGPRYTIVDPPLAVTVTGSLFYDMDHEAGVVGTGDFKPATSWEIHPITSITYAP